MNNYDITKIQSRINLLKRIDDFSHLRLFLLRLLSDYPDEYYFMAELSSACYQLRKYIEALTYAQESYQLAPDDYWVRYIYGCALSANDKLEEAAEMFNSIIACDVAFLADYKHGEGKRWAESLLNDSRYMRAVIYQQEGNNLEARDLFQTHKSIRRRGLYSDFSIKQVNEHIKWLDMIIGDTDRDYSISKYRPQFYDAEGCYIHNEWTSISDIGKSFADGILTADEYIEAENRYIDTAIHLAELAGCSYLTVSYIESDSKDIVNSVNSHKLNHALIERAKTIRQGLRISLNDCPDYLRLCLRECCWAVFSNKIHNFLVKYGYDYYMHVHTAVPKNQVVEIVTRNGLYLRP